MYYNPYYQQPSVQNNSFVSVPSEDVARNYPVAPGNSITFKNENAPYVYTKTMFSQFDQPTFEKYRLVKEGEEKECCSKDEIEKLWGEINALKSRTPARRKKDVESGNDEQCE